jgi:hypothetical protein
MKARPVFEGATKLGPDVLGRQLYVEHGGVDMSVTHEAHQGRQRDTGAHHVRTEGVAAMPHEA